MTGAPDPFRPPAWSWSYVTFRFADGFTNALLSLAVILHYGLPLWALAVQMACMNLATVPASFLWGRVMERSRHRRRWAVAGFAASAVSLAVLATLPPFPVFVAAGMTLYFFGVATGPAASTLVLQNVRRPDWAKATSRLSRRTGLAFLLGTAASTALAFSRHLDFGATFAAGSVLTAGACFLAFRLVPAMPAPLPHEARYDAGTAQATVRIFERPVFLPLRMLFRPNLADLRRLVAPHSLWPIGYALVFSGSVSFFSSYPGLLSSPAHLGLSAGLVLLCQAPSHIVSPLTYPWAGRLGSRIGESRGIRYGATVRLLAVPLLCLLLLLTDRQVVPIQAAIPVLLALHASMGLSFALLQVNGPVILAETHPSGRGHGVGAFHAAVGLGTLLGSLVALLLLSVFKAYWVSYVYAVLASTLGATLLFVAHRRHEASRGPQRPSAPPGVGVA